jgi:translation initiation factor 2 subunit 2
MSATYDPIALLKKAYVDIEGVQKPSKTSKLLLTTPDVVFQNKKTFVKNYGELCERLGKPQLEIKQFFETELNAVMSIDSNDMLIINGKYNQVGIKNVVTSYIKQYMMCSECKSTDTEMIKENRIMFLKCKKCYSKKSMTNQ